MCFCRFAGVSDQLQRVAKEQERKELLYSSAKQTSSAASLKTQSTSKLTDKDTRSPAAKRFKKASKGKNKDEEEAAEMSFDRVDDAGDEEIEGDGVKVKGKSGAKGRRKATAGKKSKETATQIQPETSMEQPAPVECEYS